MVLNGVDGGGTFLVLGVCCLLMFALVFCGNTVIRSFIED